MHIYLSNFVLGHTYLKAVGSNFVYMESIRIVCKLDPYTELPSCEQKLE